MTVAGWVRDRHQSRRKVRLTVHRAFAVKDSSFLTTQLVLTTGPTLETGDEYYFITVTNASRDRDIVVTHVWIESTPPIHVHDLDLPKRLAYNAPWETAVAVDQIPDDTTDVEWLARCQLTPDDKVVKSRPRRNIPPFGAIPRG